MNVIPFSRLSLAQLQQRKQQLTEQKEELERSLGDNIKEARDIKKQLLLISSSLNEIEQRISKLKEGK